MKKTLTFLTLSALFVIVNPAFAKIKRIPKNHVFQNVESKYSAPQESIMFILRKVKRPIFPKQKGGKWLEELISRSCGNVLELSYTEEAKWRCKPEEKVMTHKRFEGFREYNSQTRKIR